MNGLRFLLFPIYKGDSRLMDNDIEVTSILKFYNILAICGKCSSVKIDSKLKKLPEVNIIQILHSFKFWID